MNRTAARALLAAAALLPASVSAAEAWLPTADGKACGVQELALEMSPRAEFNQQTSFGWAKQYLVTPENDAALEVRYAEKILGALGFSILVLPNDGVYADGTAGLRVSLDGKPVPALDLEPIPPEGARRVVKWQALDMAGFTLNLRRAKAVNLEFLDAKGKPMRTRTIDVTPVVRAHDAIHASRWAC